MNMTIKNGLTTLALCATSAGSLAAAPNVDSFWDYTQTVKAEDWDSGANPGGVPVYTVPADKYLIITDVVMTHNVSTTSDTFRANIRRGPASNTSPCATAGLVLGPYVSPNETVSINLHTGIVYAPGDQLCIVVGSAGGSDGITFHFTGRFLNAGGGDGVRE